jgi:hypothetical protein
MSKRKPVFSRVLGRRPCLKEGEALIRSDLDTIAATFGPPEIQRLQQSKRLFWNFRSLRKSEAFSLWVEIPNARKSTRSLNVEASTSSHGTWLEFFDWCFDRFGAVSNRDERPAVLNGAGFVVVPA